MNYLHTYESSEQDRLQRQADLLKPMLYQGWDIVGQPARILEVGCGTGAQLKNLRERFPSSQIVGLDRSPEQLATAARLLQGLEVELIQGDAEHLPWTPGSFDLVCVTFVLEHLSDPKSALLEMDRVMAPNAWVILSEVHNSSLYLFPECPCTQDYWRLYNEMQRSLGGHPDIGVQLPYLARSLGWKIDQYRNFAPCLDGRLQCPEERARVIAFWTDLLASALPSLLASGFEADQFVAVRAELANLLFRPDSVLDYSARQLIASKT